MKIKKGDLVRVIYGKDKGREGKIEKVYRKKNQVLIPGINLYKRHIKKNEKMPQGGIVSVPRPLDASKVMIVCKSCKHLTRVGYQVKKGKKIRICKQCGSQL